MIHGLYTVEEAAQLSGLKPQTIRVTAYCSTLIRGRDFTTLRRYRFGRCQHKLVFTKKGVERLIARDFQRIRSRPKSNTLPRDRGIIERLYRESKGVKLGSPNTIEGKLRRKQLRFAELAKFLYETSCPLIACQCMCHTISGGIYPVISDARASTDSQDITLVAEKKESGSDEA